MKKGLILALMMVAMVAMTIPAAAMAPEIGELPTIILGDSGAANSGDDGGVTKGFMRNAEALDLSDDSIVDWMNDEYTSDLFKAYVAQMSTAYDVRAYDGADFLGAITSDTLAAAKAADDYSALDSVTSYTESSSDFMLSLFDYGYHDAAGAVPAPNSTTWSEGVEVGSVAYDEETQMMLLCGVTSGTGLVTDDSVFTVKMKTGSAPAQVPTYEQNYTFNGSKDGWEFGAVAGFNDVTAYSVDSDSGATAIGFDLGSGTADTGNPAHAKWSSPYNLDASEANQGKVYEVVASLVASAGTVDASPGYRLTFNANGFTHFGQFMMEHSDATVSSANFSTGSSATEARIYFAPPAELTEMGDSESLADWDGTGTDMRTYRVTFDSVAWPGETGSLQMDSMVVRKFDNPAYGTPDMCWGAPQGTTLGSVDVSAALDFNADAATANGWAIGQNDLAIPGFTTVKTGTMAAGSFAVGLATSGGAQFVKVETSDGTNSYQVDSDTLYRFTTEMQSSDATKVGVWRMSLQLWNNSNDAEEPGYGYAISEGLWEESFNTGTSCKVPYYAPADQDACPAVPVATGYSAVDFFLWSHTEAASREYHILPLFSMYDEGAYDADTVQWGTPDATVTVTYAGFEALSRD